MSVPATPSRNASPPAPSRQSTSRLTPFQRFMKLGRKRTDGTLEFPPAHWVVEENQTRGSPVPEPSPEVPVRPVILEPLAAPTTPDGAANSEVDVSTPPHGTTAADTMPQAEPTSLARKTQALLASWPPFTSVSSTSETPAAAGSASASAPADKRPVLPKFISDSQLVALLSSPSVMNGSLEKGRQSVWAALDRLRSTVGLPAAHGQADEQGEQGRVDGNAVAARDSDDTSLMLYGPLEPDDSSMVEVAPSVMSLEDDATAIGPEEGRKEDALEAIRARIASMWPRNRPQGPEGEPVPTGQPKQKKVWVPSRTKISLEVRWWGYRIYLPPPVLAILDNRRIEASKRAALLATALKWMLDHVPTVVVPAQARPALAIFKRLVPYLAYIGAFVAWSWEAIRSFDKGNGVILTATWLLTFALIPGTWEADQFPAAPPSEDARDATNST